MEAINFLMSNPYSRKTFDVFNILIIDKTFDTITFVGSFSTLDKLIIRKLYSGVNVKFCEAFNFIDTETSFQDSLPILIPLEEEFILKFYDYRNNFSITRIKAMLPDEDVFRIVRNKYKMSCFFESKIKNAIPKLYKTQDSIRNDEIIIKPIIGSGSRGIIWPKKNSKLPEEYFSDKYIIQERIQAKEGVIGLFLLAKEGRLINYYCHQRIHTYPRKGGVTVLSKIRKDENLEFKNLGSEIVRFTKWSGLMMIELMKDSQDHLKIIEINPRIWGSIIGTTISEINLLNNYINLISTRNEKITNNIAKNYIFWLLPFGLKSLTTFYFWKKVFRNSVYINISNSTIYNSIIFHFALYLFKIREKINSI